MSGAPGPPGWSKSAITPAQPAPPAVEALAVKIARQNYPGYASIVRCPSISLMIKAGLWIELEATVGFILGLGLASLMGQRTGPVILIIVLQLILTPILAVLPFPICRACSDHSSGWPWRTWSLPGCRWYSGCRG